MNFSSHTTYILATCLLLLTGCYGTMNTPSAALYSGDWQSARAHVESEVTPYTDRSERRWMLSRIRAGVLACDTQDFEAAEAHLADSFDMYRTQGLNADRTLAAIAAGEGVRIWKGEPFEQAMMLAYYGVDQAALGSWDNMRAAAQNSLFALKDPDFDEDNDEAISENGYVAISSDFALGHILHAIASDQMGRTDERDDHLQQTLALRPDLRQSLSTVSTSDYNTVLVIAAGLSPELQHMPEANELTHFVNRTQASANMVVNANKQQFLVPYAVDLNLMANEYRWRDFEKIRRIKSYAANALIVGGVITAQLADNTDTALLGLGLMITGAIIDATNYAHLDYCDVYPQSWYILPIELTGMQTVTVELNGHTHSLEIRQPDGRSQLIYHRLPANGVPTNPVSPSN